ncbi:F0F1 ATP synthase subunit alpha [Burkholderiaceae bacterium FT117]|uniref:F0F1 ATP synthase subunit alpha n=1 Tax=Zeimonas sediminis TaxID=2944268 RepID=UPI0023431B2A|nr:F0F1 ATP synthase subunit alpha [Zeimonas sediminis]MCM5569442.1 F0F1 ATP synthase subunit alpha [Zeimonas sediminis]
MPAEPSTAAAPAAAGGERDSPLAAQRARVASYRPGLRILERGRVSSVGDGVIWIEGLPSARLDELIAFADGSVAFVATLARDRIGGVLLRETRNLKAGIDAWLPGRGLTVPVGDALLGRVVDPTGEPLDAMPAPRHDALASIDVGSPPLTEREFVERPLYTGHKIVDTMIPIGRGQRQLLIGDNGTGKSAVAIDTVLRQRGQGVRCVYVLIGQKRSTVAQTIDTLRSEGALDFTTVVVAEATASPGLLYAAPYAGCAIAEHWMRGGHDTLIVYDDLSTHARAYRELSLLLRRPPGREAYPGDIFYLHARLLERSTQLAPNCGGGSMTALPIVETEQGEIAAYIPTNLISITDGQVYFDAQLFARGFLPAIDIARSVSRIGGKAQDEAIKREAGRMKLDYLQFQELEVFTRFGAKLEASIEARIRRGRLLRELLKQEQLDPQSAASHLAWLVAYNERLLDDMPLPELRKAVKLLREHADSGELPLEASRERWVEAVRRWLGKDDGQAS